MALWQANFVKAELDKCGVQTEIKIIKTQGDKIQHLSFDKMEGKGFFTKEIEASLNAGEIDLAVHSHKDLETTNPNGLTIAAVSSREDPADILVIRKECTDKGQKFNLKLNPVVGTSSARRKAQMLDFRPDISIEDIRGNVPTRLQKLRDGKYDAILLAYAGVKRLKLDMSDFEVVKMDVRAFVPAPAQGVLGFQVRENDVELIELLKINLNDSEVEKCIQIEREVLRRFQGGCQMPLGVYCEQTGEGYFEVFAAKADTWNAPVKRSKAVSSNFEDAVVQIMKQL